MQNPAASPQEPQAEPKDKVVAVRCTATEKRAVQLLALVLESTESDLVRERSIADIVAEAESHRAKLAS